MRPAQGAVPGIDPQALHGSLANKRYVGGCARPQRGPVARVAPLIFGAGVTGTGEQLLDTVGQHVASRARHGRVQRQIKPAQFDGPGHANLVAQAADGNFAAVVQQRHRRCQVRAQHLEGCAVALAGVNRQVNADAAQQRRAVGTAGHHHCIAFQYQVFLASSACWVSASSYTFYSASFYLQGVHLVAVKELRATLGAAFCQTACEKTGVAAFITAGKGAADDAAGIGGKRRFNVQQFFARDQPPLHPIFAHQIYRHCGIVERLAVGIKVRNAAFETIEGNAGAGHNIFQRMVAVSAQSDQLLHIARKSGVVALG